MTPRFGSLVAITTVLLLYPLALGAQEWDRIALLGKIWAGVAFEHPWLVDDAWQWDSVTVDAIPQVLDVRSDAEFAEIIRRLFSTLRDPSTRVDPPIRETVSGEISGAATFSLLGEAAAVLAIPDPNQVFAAKSQEAISAATTDTSPRLIIDLRGTRPAGGYGRAILPGALEPVLRSSILRQVTGPAERRRIAFGFDNLSPFSSGQYRSSLETQAAPFLRPLPDSRHRLLVFVVNRFSVITPMLGALQQAGLAGLVFEGLVTEQGFGITRGVALPDGSTANIRTADLVFPDGRSGEVVVDTVIPPGADSVRAIRAALALSLPATPRSMSTAPGPAAVTRRPWRNPGSEPYPNRAARIFAALKFWHVIDRFYPHLDLLGEEWTAVRPRLLHAFSAAADSLEYARAVAAAAAALHDGHAYVAGGAYSSTLMPSGMPALRVRIIENVPLVTQMFDSSLADLGVHIGDEVVSVAGRPVAERIEAISLLFSASTPWGLLDKVSLGLLAGPDDHPIQVTLRDASGALHDIDLPRRHEDYRTLYHRERGGEVIRWLANGIGYVDLDRLAPANVDSVFQLFAAAEGIIFDMRGYPNGTMWMIAPRLATRPAIAARFATPAPGLPSQEAVSLSFVQTVTPDPDPTRHYAGRTVLLIDERSQSQAEHTGLFYKAANGTVFVGSPTSGADGEITSITLPGGYTVGFTGQAVTWPDGSRLQRTGLQPDVVVRPTIAGIRAGRDEVLEAAERFLRSKR